MTALDGYGLVAAAVLLLVFYFVRTISVQVLAGAAVPAAFAIVTRAWAGGSDRAEWGVLVVGLLAFAFGLLIVRVMLIRSVSLHLLGRIEAATTDEGLTAEGFAADIGGRLGDMRTFHLIQPDDRRILLTPFGSFVSGVVATFYFLFRIEA